MVPLPVAKIVAAKDYALAEAARPFLGRTGFLLIAIAAMLSTASAINATIYGAARLSYIIAKDGELPEALEHKIWGRPVEGLLITSAATLLIANLADISSMSIMGSAGFLLIFAAVNRSKRQTCSQYPEPALAFANRRRPLSCGPGKSALANSPNLPRSSLGIVDHGSCGIFYRADI